MTHCCSTIRRGSTSGATVPKRPTAHLSWKSTSRDCRPCCSAGPAGAISPSRGWHGLTIPRRLPWPTNCSRGRTLRTPGSSSSHGGDALRAVVVIGAGICGLAAAYELARRGERTIVLERGEPFAEQSVGLARIFRVAHRRPTLCRLAIQARAGWQRWETELGAGRLLGSEGFIAAGACEDTATAMAESGATFSWLDRAGIAARIPFIAAPWDTAVFD